MRLGHVRRGTAPAAGRSRDRGFSLVEMLIAVVLLGLLVGTVITGLFTATRSSMTSREKAEMAVYMQAWADQTLAPVVAASGAINYSPCAAPPSGQLTPPSGWRRSWRVEFLQVDNSVPPPYPPTGGWAAPTFDRNAGLCKTYEQEDPVSGNKVVRDGGVQKITLYVATENGPNQIVESMVLYKRDPRCSPQYNNADLGPC